MIQSTRKRIGWAIITAVAIIAVAVIILNPSSNPIRVSDAQMGAFECVANRNVVHRYENATATLVSRKNNQEDWLVSSPGSQPTTLTVNPRFTKCGYVN